MPGQTGKSDLPPNIKKILQKVRALGEQFKQSKDPQFLDRAINTYEALLRDFSFQQLKPPHQMFLLDSVGELYGTRARLTGRQSDFDRSLLLRRDAILLMPLEWEGADDVLHNMAFEFRQRYERTRNLQHLDEYAQLAWLLPRSHRYAFAHLNNLGIEWMGRYEDEKLPAFLAQAIECFEEASKISSAGDRAARALTPLVMALHTRCLHSQEKADFDRYRGAVTRLPSSDPHRAGHLTEHGRLVFNLYEINGDIALLQEAIQSHEGAVELATALAKQRKRLGSWLDRLWPTIDDGAPSEQRCRYVANLGTTFMARYEHLGQPTDLEQAIDNLQKAVDGSHRNASERSSRLASLGDAFRLRYQATRIPADLQSAIENFELSVARTPKESRELPSHLISLGTGLIDRFELAGKVEDLKLAIKHIREAIHHAGPSDPDFPMYLSDLGTALSRLSVRDPNAGYLDEAVEVFGRAVDMASRRGARAAKLPGYLNNLATALAMRHERLGTRADLERSIRASREVIKAINPRAPMLPSFLANLGSRCSTLYRETKDPEHLDAAIESWEEALRALHASYGNASLALKIGGQRMWPALYTNLASAYLRRFETNGHRAATDLRRVIEISEQSKAYILAEQFSRAEMPAPSGVSTATQRREHLLLAELSQLDSAELAVYSEQAAPQLKSGALGALQRREQIGKELQRIWNDIESLGPDGADYVALRRGDAPLFDELARIASKLGAETALLSVFSGPVNSAVFIIQDGREPRWIDAQIDGAGWQRIWSMLTSEMHSAGANGRSPESWDVPLRSLASKLLTELGPVKRVVLAPHAFGHLIPWPALFARIGSKIEGQALLPVTTIPTLKVLPSLFAPAIAARTKGTAIVVGNPRGDLPFAEDEARLVSAKLGALPLIRKKATKSAVLHGLSDASVVHLATHAYWVKGNPLESGVVLADGVLTAREVMQHHLRTDLLVLSACETGLGGSLGGDELAGLGRAFLHAGARSILMSLWEVDDEATACLMTGFYEAYTGGVDKAEALASAMTIVRARPAWQHTRYWGAFTLMGHWS